MIEVGCTNIHEAVRKIMRARDATGIFADSDQNALIFIGNSKGWPALQNAIDMAHPSVHGAHKTYRILGYSRYGGHTSHNGACGRVFLIRIYTFIHDGILYTHGWQACYSALDDKHSYRCSIILLACLMRLCIPDSNTTLSTTADGYTGIHPTTTPVSFFPIILRDIHIYLKILG